MKKTKETLWKEYDNVCTQIESLEIGHEKYQMLLDQKDKILNDLIKCEQISTDAEIKKHQIDTDNKLGFLGHLITGFSIIGSLAITMYGVKKTFKFDETATITSTMGRPILNGIVPKIIKR